MWRYIMLFLLLSARLWASFEGYEYGSKALSMGTAFTALSNDCFAIFFNPAGLSHQRNNEIAFFILPSQFGFKELSTAVLASKFNIKFGTIGIAIKKFGFELYSEITGSVAFSKEFSGLNFGSTLNINYLSIKNYGNDITLGLDAGVLIPFASNIFIGFNIKNINVPTIGVNKEKLPFIILSGITYYPIDNFVLTFDLQKEYQNDVAFASGAEYKIFDFVFVRLGFRNIPSTFTSGLGFKYNYLRMDYSLIKHDQLGITHSITLSLLLGGMND